MQLKTGPATQPLPKATVQLQRTQPVTSAPPTTAVGSSQLGGGTQSFDTDEDEEPAGMSAIAGAAAAIAFILMIIMMMGSDKVSIFVQKSGSPSWGVPDGKNPGWEKKKPSGGFINTFQQNYLTEIPEREK